MRRRRLLLLAAVLSTLLPLASSAQRRGSAWSTHNVEYNGRFTFTRIQYGGFGRGGGNWAHDYPQADRNLPRIAEYVSYLDPNLEGTNVLRLDDPQIYLNPIIYISEPGFWRPTDSEIENLGRYLRKGGFVIFDDFERNHLVNVETQMRRALPELNMIEIDVTHPIFQSFFALTSIDTPHPMMGLTPTYYGIFEENNPHRRMMAIINHDNDLAEYWEWSDSGMFPVDLTNEAYKVGVNYLVYGLTH